MDLLVPWLLAPALFGALTLGSGLLVERAGGFRMPVPLLFGVGFCGLVCVSQVLTLSGTLAPVTPWAVLALALAGWVLGYRRVRDAGLDRAGLALVLAVFAVYAAPTVFTGHVTFLGYGNQGDGGFHFLLADHLLSHGYDLDGFPKSSYSGTLKGYFDTSYPTGAHTVLGSWRALTGQDVAWLLEPYLAALVALSALGLYGLLRRATDARWPAALAAGLAASGGLIYAYANNQQALKELAALLVIVTAVGSVPVLLAAAPSWRAGVPAAIVVAGGLGVLSLALAPWLGPLLLVAAAGLWLRHRRRPAQLGLLIGGFAIVSVLLSLPVLARAQTFVSVTNVALTGAEEFGNLIGPLPFVHVFGVWPADDFRHPLPAGVDAAWLLIGAVALAALFGLLAAVRRGAWSLVLFAGVSLVGFLVVAGRASPWAYAKALMLLSPVALLLAGFAAIALWDERRRAEAAALLLVLGIGVGWTAARVYHSSSAAPHDRMVELSDIGERYAGRGPLLYLDADEFAKHFLRETEPTGVGEAYRQNGLAFQGRDPGFGNAADADELQPMATLEHVKLIVVRYGPESSRPSSGWRRAFHGRFYDVWAREGDPQILAHQRFGTSVSAAAPATCDQLRGLASQAREANAQLAFAPRPEAVAMVTGTRPHPAGWPVSPGSPEDLIQIGPGKVSGPVTTEAGRFDVWLRGSVERAVQIRVDGREVGVARSAISPRRSPIHVGTVTLDRGEHTVDLVVGGGSLAPGDGGIDRLLGPVAFTPAGDPTNVPVQTVPADRWRSLCGRSLDWAEVVA